MTVSKEIIEVLEYLCGKFGIAIDWTQENFLPYVQSLGENLIRYEISTSIFWIIFIAVITILIAVVTVIWFFSVKKDEFGNRMLDEFFAVSFTCAIVFFIITCIVVSVQSIDILTAIHFPEKAILDIIETLTSASA